jgi:hypothetical protein
MLHLKKRSLNWALKHALRFGDTDVFPSQFEFDAIKNDWSEISKFLLREDIHNWKTRPLRSLLSPKSRYGFRIITQLDPLDFLVFAALMYEIGSDLESERVPVADNIVFSHRFRPDSGECMTETLPISNSKSRQKAWLVRRTVRTLR